MKEDIEVALDRKEKKMPNAVENKPSKEKWREVHTRDCAAK